jgi:hypothetical protein
MQLRCSVSTLLLFVPISAGFRPTRSLRASSLEDAPTLTTYRRPARLVPATAGCSSKAGWAVRAAVADAGRPENGKRAHCGHRNLQQRQCLYAVHLTVLMQRPLGAECSNKSIGGFA